MDAVRDFLDWYLSPWRRIGRAVFNVALLAISLPGLLLSLGGFTRGAGGFLGGVMDMVNAAKSLSGLPDNPSALDNALLNMQRAGEGFGAMGAARDVAAAGFPWDALVNGVLWLALLPLVMMRLRDTGRGPRAVWVFVALVYVGVLMDLWVGIGLPNWFGGWKLAASVVGFVLIAWLCVAPTKARERVDPMTAPGGSGMVRRDGRSLDDTDPYPPFRP